VARTRLGAVNRGEGTARSFGCAPYRFSGELHPRPER